MVRKSSRGNPCHDERGRFCSANACKKKSERDYNARAEAIDNGEYDRNDAKDLRSLTKRAIESPDGGKQNRWEIRRGGYDKWYEAYYDGEAAFGVIDGNVEVYQDKYKAYAEDFASASGYKIAGQITDGSKGEVLFTFGGKRCHAEITEKLPKKGEFSNGYAEIGSYVQDGEAYVVYSDRDSSGAYAYYAVKEEIKNECQERKATGKIEATKARQDVLNDCGIGWQFYDDGEDFVFQFESKADEEKAIKALTAALEL